MTKALVFDMDGTLADLYGVPDWLEMLRSYNPTPYEVATPLVDMEMLNNVLALLKACGWRVIVTSWLSKESNKEYDKQVRKAKKEWLAQYDFPYDEIHLVKYGTRKDICSKKSAEYQILIDDNTEVRNLWRIGATVNANEDIIDALLELANKELQAYFKEKD